MGKYENIDLIVRNFTVDGARVAVHAKEVHEEGPKQAYDVTRYGVMVEGHHFTLTETEDGRWISSVDAANVADYPDSDDNTWNLLNMVNNTMQARDELAQYLDNDWFPRQVPEDVGCSECGASLTRTNHCPKCG